MERMMRMSDNLDNAMLKSLELFQAAIDKKSNLEIVCETTKTDGSGAVLVVENSDIDECQEGHQSTVEIAEIFATVTNEGSAKYMVEVVGGEKSGIQLEGVTRIVGYYSRTNNWNKSKVGELRDRAKGEYWHGANQKANQEERLAVIDQL
jgi:hypothetical protein